jgi:hypothetical protein
MLRQLLVGGLVSVLNIAIHSLVMTTVVQVSRRAALRHTDWPALRLTEVMTAAVLVLMAAHVVEVLVWALTYSLTGAVPSRFMYFAFVSYATLGYGDVLPVPEWELLGPLAAMNGVILYGWSTAVLFAVLQRALEGTR